MMQEKEENTTAFLKRLWKALKKHTYLDPDSSEGQLILKGNLLFNQLQIQRKLQVQAFSPIVDLECLLRAAISVFFNRDQEECKEKERRDKKKAEALIIALEGVNFRAAKAEVQKQKPGACFCCGKDGHFKGRYPQGKQRSQPRPRPHLAKESTGRVTGPRAIFF